MVFSIWQECILSKTTCLPAAIFYMRRSRCPVLQVTRMPWSTASGDTTLQSSLSRIDYLRKPITALTKVFWSATAGNSVPNKHISFRRTLGGSRALKKGESPTTHISCKSHLHRTRHYIPALPRFTNLWEPTIVCFVPISPALLLSKMFLSFKKRETSSLSIAYRLNSGRLGVCAFRYLLQIH
jgi:hypothetical protein